MFTMPPCYALPTCSQLWTVVLDPRTVSSNTITAQESMLRGKHRYNTKAALHQVITPDGLSVRMRTKHVKLLMDVTTNHVSFICRSTVICNHFAFYHIPRYHNFPAPDAPAPPARILTSLRAHNESGRMSLTAPLLDDEFTQGAAGLVAQLYPQDAKETKLFMSTYLGPPPPVSAFIGRASSSSSKWKTIEGLANGEGAASTVDGLEERRHELHPVTEAVQEELKKKMTIAVRLGTNGRLQVVDVVNASALRAWNATQRYHQDIGIHGMAAHLMGFSVVWVIDMERGLDYFDELDELHEERFSPGCFSLLSFALKHRGRSLLGNQGAVAIHFYVLLDSSITKECVILAMPCHATPYPCHAMPRHAMPRPCHATPRHATPVPCHAIPVPRHTRATPCHAMPCHTRAMPCHTIPVPCRAMRCHAMPCHTIPVPCLV